MIVVLVVAVILPILLFGGTHLYRAFRLRQNDPDDIRTVRAASDGPVEFRRRSRKLNGTVTAKYFDREYLAYAWEHEDRDAGSTADSRDTNYHTVDTGAAGEPFHVRDET